MVMSIVVGSKFLFLRKGPNVLLVLANILLRLSSSVSLKSNVTPRWFWEKIWETLLLLKTKGGCVRFFDLQLKITNRACLLRSELKLFFHWKAQHLIFFFKSWFKSFAELFMSRAAKNIDEPPGKSFALKKKSSDIDLIIIKILFPAQKLLQDKFWPLINTLCFPCSKY